VSGAAPKRILAVDFGDRRTGLAGTDPTGTLISPLTTLVGLDDQACAAAVAALARERQAEVIVVGVPLAARGEVGARARRTLAFVRQLERVAPCAVATVDESHTTDAAHEQLKRAGVRAARRKRLADRLAAMAILERFRRGG
jgi:putative Holliday junction resolvase